MYYIYHLIDPRSGATFYVGKGKGSRVSAHEAEAKRGVESDKCNLIREIWRHGLQVERVITKRFKDEARAYAAEAEEIRRIGLDNLTNQCRGGGGSISSQPAPFRWTYANIKPSVRSMADMIRRVGAGTILLAGVDLKMLMHKTINGMVKDCGEKDVVDAFMEHGVDISFAGV